MKLHTMIKRVRESYRETQSEFGNRFHVTATAVSLWESGQRQAPYEVLEWVLDASKEPAPFVDCNKCGGSGYIVQL